jgi:hypothetical protein
MMSESLIPSDGLPNTELIAILCEPSTAEFGWHQDCTVVRSEWLQYTGIVSVIFLTLYWLFYASCTELTEATCGATISTKVFKQMIDL